MILSSSQAKVNVKDANVEIQFEFSVVDINKVYQAELSQVAVQTKVSGFRKGKAKAHIEKRDGARIRVQAIEKLLEQEIKAVVTENQHELASSPLVKESKGDGVETAIAMQVEYEIFPPIQEVDLAKVKVDGVTTKVTAQDISDEVKRLQEHFADWKGIDAAAKKGLRLKIDYAGKIDNELFEGGSAKDQYMVIGESQFMPEFEKALGKAKKGDVCAFDVKFPKDYHGAEVAGKTAQFEVTVNAVEEKTLPSMNKEFYKKAGVDAKTKAEFEKELKSRLEADVEYLVDAVNRRRLLNELQKKIKVVQPQSVIDEEVKAMMEKDPKLTEKTAKASAIANMEKVMIVRHYLKSTKVSANPQEVKTHIEMMAPPQVSPDQFFQWYVQDKNRIQQAQSTLLEQKTLSELLKQVDLKAKTMSIKDIEAELRENA